MGVNIGWLVTTIEAHCQKFEYFWAVELIKETLNLWKIPENLALLEPTAQIFAKHYLKEVKNHGDNIS